MRILVHDYAGHPFQAELSRELAHRGCVVRHIHCGSYASGKGELTNGDAALLTFREIRLRRTFAKHSLLRRPAQELEYARTLVGDVRAFAPDVVLSANTPLLAQVRLCAAVEKEGAAFVFWLQDLISQGVARYLKHRLGLAGRWIGWCAEALERRTLARSDAVVAISPAFVPILSHWAIPVDRVTVIENWAPLDDVRPTAKVNEWSREHGLDRRRVILYAGTLGLKHESSLLLALARDFVNAPDVVVVVVSSGTELARLREAADSERIENLVCLPFQEYRDVPEMLGSADVLLALLERGAAAFSVPSKVLTYLCAGRAIVGAIPAENLAAETLESSGGGLVVPPGDAKSLCEAVRLLLDDPVRRASMGKNARRFAEREFRIEAIADRFMSVCAAACESRRLQGRLAPRPSGRTVA